jgi:Ca-activated chloride channel family protein
MTGGRYFRARDTAELAGIYALLDELEPAESDEAGFRPVQEMFHWPLGLAAALALVATLAVAVPLSARRRRGGHG